MSRPSTARVCRKTWPPGRLSSAGFSLIEVMIALTIVSIVIAGATTIVKHKVDDQAVARLQLAKTRMVKQLEDAVNDPNNIATSARILTGPNGLNNRIIANCGSPTNTCPTQFTNANTPRTMDLYVPDGKGNFISFNGLWSNDGLPMCTPNAATICPWQVDIYFWFNCPVNRITGTAPTSCVTPPAMNIYFQIKPSNAVPHNAALKGFNFYYPGTSATIPNKKAIAFSLTSSSVFNIVQTCPVNQYVDGFDNSGRVICACNNHKPARDAGGNIILDSQNHPTCQNLTCAAPNRLVGFSTDPSTGDWVPTCVNPNTLNCYPVDLSVAGNCAPGYYITKVDIGACTLDTTATKKKGAVDPGTVVCASDSGTCCQGAF